MVLFKFMLTLRLTYSTVKTSWLHSVYRNVVFEGGVNVRLTLSPCRYLSQVMRLNFTRESHLRRYNRLLSYNLLQEMDLLK